MRIDAGLDTGDMLLKAETEIGAGRKRRGTGRAPGGDGCGAAGARRWTELEAGESRREKQDDAQATYAPLLKKEDGAIDWNQPARGDPQPHARLPAVARRLHGFRGQTLHIWRSRRGWCEAPAAGRGCVLGMKPLVVGCGEGRLELWKFSWKAASACPPRISPTASDSAENEMLGECIRVNLPLGYRYAATYAGIRQVEKDDLALIVSGAAGRGRRRVHAESRAGRAGEAVPPPSEGFARAGRRDAGQCRQRQLRHAHGRRGGAGQRAKRPRKLLRLPVEAGAARFHRRDRRGTGSAARSSTRCRGWSRA